MKKKKKSDSTIRFCVDYRKLNSVMRLDVHPLSCLNDTLDCLKGALYFSTLDLSEYWQLPITPDVLYHFSRLPYGFSNAPATFQHLMDKDLECIKWTMGTRVPG